MRSAFLSGKISFQPKISPTDPPIRNYLRRTERTVFYSALASGRTHTKGPKMNPYVLLADLNPLFMYPPRPSTPPKAPTPSRQALRDAAELARLERDEAKDALIRAEKRLAKASTVPIEKPPEWAKALESLREFHKIYCGKFPDHTGLVSLINVLGGPGPYHLSDVLIRIERLAGQIKDFALRNDFVFGGTCSLTREALEALAKELRKHFTITLKVGPETKVPVITHAEIFRAKILEAVKAIQLFASTEYKYPRVPKAELLDLADALQGATGLHITTLGSVRKAINNLDAFRRENFYVEHGPCGRVIEALGALL